MSFRHLFQFIAMLVAPVVTFAGFYVILYVSTSLALDIFVIFLLYRERDMWDPWEPAIAKNFLINAEKLGW